MKLPSHLNSVKGFLDHDEGICLYNHALSSSKKGPILEIGSYCGKSTIYLATAAKEYNCSVYSVDHHTGSEENQVGWEYHDIELFDEETGKINSFPEFMRNLRKANLLDTVIPIVSDSSLVSRDWKIPLSMVFIDGGHTMEAAFNDFNNWKDKIIKGGILAIHDVFPNPDDGGRPPFEIYRKALSENNFKEVEAVKSLRILEKLNETII
ncbi:MAG: class I SAM-dependent methyltransferase [Pseudomonadota bacterium]|jgi:predicted O-methyltransferase YrrM|nr:class I SAM-dependent methyltransferase [Pseudomonadota bacterium]MED5484895.1 class I SAM-dependent methyltransferase [Pseudomonadota bacterium]|tara:strand:- start:889 stop:1515 length:627 start_codon:yes stop_codon:yes gene_type:complete